MLLTPQLYLPSSVKSQLTLCVFLLVFLLQGWSTSYDFSVADLRAGADVVSRAAASSGPGGPDWQQLLGLLQVIYSGRVDAKQDTQVRPWHMFTPARQ